MKKTVCNATEKNYDNAKKPYGYAFYSKVLEKPFESLEELTYAEDMYFAELKEKEAKAAEKKADATKVEEAFKALNTARKEYKEKLTQLTTEYAESLENLKKAFDLGKKDIHAALVTAEENYEAALKEFTDKHTSYHLSLKDGDFETTISGSTTVEKSMSTPSASAIFDIFDWMFRI